MWHRWPDGVALALIIAVKVYLLASYGINDHRDNDAVGYIALANQLLQAQTWTRVPDLDSAMMPVSLLRIPGYALLIIAVRGIAGPFWMPAMIGLHLIAATAATFLLYRAVWRISEIWLFAVAGVLWVCISHIGNFDRFILTDSLSISLFTALVAWLAMAAVGDGLARPWQFWTVGLGFAAAFLLREANIVYAFSLAPLALLAVRRVRALVPIYAPVVAAFLLVGTWQFYRTGQFLITTGGQSGPVLAIAIADKMSPMLGESVVDKAIRDITAAQSVDDIKRAPMTIVYDVNRLLIERTGARAPELARMLLGRYLQGWLSQPLTMLEYVKSQEHIARITGVSPYLYNDARLGVQIRDTISFRSQQAVVCGMAVLPVVLLFAAAVPPFRRCALVGLAVWLFAAATIAVYISMYLEHRYILEEQEAHLVVDLAGGRLEHQGRLVDNVE